MTQERRTIDSAVIDAMAKARGRSCAYRPPETLEKAAETATVDTLTPEDMQALMAQIEHADEVEAAVARAEQDCRDLSGARG